MRLDESRVYHTIPANLGGGDSAANYDATTYKYDSMGRPWRTRDATATIVRTVYDAIGRPIESWMGTDDTGWPYSPLSGTDNMTKTETREYDGGGVGNSRLTKVTRDADGNWGTTGDQRVSQFLHDYRGRAVVTINPVSPHGVVKHDNRGRVLAAASYSSSSGLTAATDPTSNATNRLSLEETLFDARGQVYRQVSRKVRVIESPGDGTFDSADDLTTNFWYDARGSLLKSAGESITKHTYDRLGRQVRTFTIGITDDTDYADAADVSGDVVLEEMQTFIESTTGNALLSAAFSRTHDASATFYGPLDENTDSSDSRVTATDLTSGSPAAAHARVQIAAMWYDDLDRPTDTVQYGTYELTESGGPSHFERSALSVPARSDTALRTSTSYNKDGTVDEVTDPMARKTKYLYDGAGRQTAVIANSTGATPPLTTADRDTDLYTRTAYTNGLVSSLLVDLDGDGVKDTDDQETVYTYGTTKGGSFPDSQIATGHLLRQVAYPDSAGSGDVVTKAYNALSEEIWTEDQHDTRLETRLDTAGRITARVVSNLGTGIDGSVRRIGMTYTLRGMVEAVTQYDDPSDSESSGDITDQVKYVYDDRSMVKAFQQDHDSAVSGSGYDEVAHNYSRVAPTGGWNLIRRTSTILPDSVSGSPGTVTVAYGYGTGGGLNDSISRVQKVTVGAVDVAQYGYLGLVMVVNTTLPEFSSVKNALHHATDAGRYDKLDRFNRITRDQWQGGLLDLGLTYDRNSNITSISAPRVSRASTSVQLTGWADRKFGIDGLDRISDDDWGTLSSGVISARTFRQDWGLSQTGNWSTFRIDGNGDSTWDTTDTRTHNAANELLTRSAPSATLAHDAAGNMTDNGRVKLKYDGFGRLVARIDRTDGTTVLSSYRYNGLGMRIIERSGTSGTPTRFIYDERWRIVATYEGSATTPKKRLVHHNAGLAGMGGSSYIDGVILHDADEAGDSTLEARTYTLQNWRADVAIAAKVGTSGTFVCRGYVVYEAYGKATSYPLNSADFNGDDGVDDADNTAFFAAFSNGDPEADLNMDDAIDDLDITAWNALFQSGVTKEPGAGALSGLLVGYAGYMRDGFDDDLYHVRHRVYDTDLGRWTRRDPLGYVDGMSEYEYVQSHIINSSDAYGLYKNDTIIDDPNSCADCGISNSLPRSDNALRASLACSGGECGMRNASDLVYKESILTRCNRQQCLRPSPMRLQTLISCNTPWHPHDPLPISPSIPILPAVQAAHPSSTPGAGSHNEPEWSQCFMSCMDKYHGDTSFKVCIFILGIDFLVGRTAKTPNELKRPHKERDYVTRLRRWQVSLTHTKVRRFLRVPAKILFAGHVGKYIAAASCGYAAGVSISCAAICHVDRRSF